MSSYAFSLSSGLVSWSSKKQPTIVTSSTKAEYLASCHGTKKAIWLRSLLKSLGHSQDHPSCIHCDHAGSNILTHDQSFHSWTKHIDLQHHYVHEWVEAGDIHFAYIPLMPILLIASPNRFHAQNFKSLQLIWRCAMTFQLEGGCWNQ